MRRFLKVLGIVLLALVVVVGGGAVILAVTAPGPRDAENWQPLPDMPDPRGETAFAVIRLPGDPPRERMYVMGGIGGVGRSVRTVSAYDPVAQTWGTGPDLPERRDHAAAASLAGTVYLSGGATNALRATPESNMWTLPPDADGWFALPPMPEGRWGHQMVAYDDHLYVVGGDGPSGRVLIFDPGDGWELGAEMPVQRDHLVVVVASDRIWAIGGRSGLRTLLDRVDIYDPERDTWEPGPPLPEPLSAMSGGVIDGAIHIVGGEDPGFTGGVTDVHYRLDLETRTWEEAELPIVAVHGAPGAVVGERLVIAGGSRRQGAFSILGWTGITQAYPAP